MNQEKFLEIINDLHSGKDTQKGWHYILKKIKNLLNVDIIFFAKVIDEKTFECFSSEEFRLSDCVFENPIASRTISSKKTIIVNNYQDSDTTDDYWVEKGVKSVVSVPILFSDIVFGALQIVSFSSKHIEEKDIEVLKAFSKIISFVLYYRMKSESTEKILSLMVKEFEFFYSRRLPDFFNKESLKVWIVEYLKNIMEITYSSAIGFAFPKENIYVVVAKKNGSVIESFYTRLTGDVEDFILYKIWEKSIGDIISFEEIFKYGIKPSNISKKIGIKSALFVPVKHNGEIKVVVGFGYDKKISIDRDYRLALQNCATHLTFMLLAAKNLTLVNNRLIDVEESFLESFVLLMEARDIYTKGHSLRVAYYAKKIAEAIGEPIARQKKYYIAGLLHDIGKIGIPDNILLKPGRLTPHEYEIIKNHAEFSFQIIKNVKSFQDIADFVRYHHERCNGSGYPRGLMHSEIPLGAKILAIADVFDAVTTTRPYRKELSLDSALELLVGMKEELDQAVVLKSLGSLKDAYAYIKGTFDERNFLPEDIDTIREKIFTTDYMTGLLRRKQFLENVEEFMRQYERFYMFYFDIKKLSYINHRYSMGIGDKIILYTAEALKYIEDIRFLSRTEPDAFYFVYYGKEEPGIFMIKLKGAVKSYVVDKLSKEEMDIEGWKKIIDYYVSFSEYLPGKTAEDMMFECKQRKKEIEELLI